MRLGILVACAISSAVSHAQLSYHIGNSLTWDGRPKAFPNLAEQSGLGNYEVGWHINCNQSLLSIWNDPDTVCVNPVEPFGTFVPALTSFEWFDVTYQPHPGPDSTLKTDETVILDMIDLARSLPANDDAVHYVYAAWPRISGFQDTWWSDESDEDDTKTIHAAAYYGHLIERVRRGTIATVRMVPAGWVLDEMRRRIARGEVPGVDEFARLYRDDLHMSQDIGRFIVAMTHWATLTEAPTFGLEAQDGLFGDGSAFTPALYDAIHDAVWDVVASHPYALPCRIDLVRDGVIDIDDLFFFLDAFADGDGIADFTRNGVVDQADLDAFTDEYTRGCWPVASRSAP